MRSWYGVDETREPWCFLSLTVGNVGGDSSLIGWALADGNAGQLVSTEHRSLEPHDKEAELMVALSEALDARRYMDRILVTAERDTMAEVRQNLLSCPSIPSPTLRGFTHIALGSVLDQYFAGASPSEVLQEEGDEWSTSGGTRHAADLDDPAEAVELLWQVWTTIYRLIPVTACLGDPL